MNSSRMLAQWPALTLAAIALPLLAGCAGTDADIGTDVALTSPTPSPSTTRLCPPGGDGSPPIGDCIPVDTEANMDLNNAYAERLPISLEEKEALDVWIEPVTEALQPLAAGAVPVTAASVTEALKSAGIESPQLKGDTAYIGFAYGTGGGCLFGEVKAGLLTVETGGIIADGGCMTAPGY